LIEKYVPEAARTWAISRFSADNGETQAAVDQAQALPMLSPTQVVFLEDGEAIEKLGEKARDEAVKTLEAYLENPAPCTVLVIEASGLDQRMRLAKVLQEKALVVEVGLGENVDERVAAAAVLAKSLAKEQGIEFETVIPHRAGHQPAQNHQQREPRDRPIPVADRVEEMPRVNNRRNHPGSRGRRHSHKILVPTGFHALHVEPRQAPR